MLGCHRLAVLLLAVVRPLPAPARGGAMRPNGRRRPAIRAPSTPLRPGTELLSIDRRKEVEEGAPCGAAWMHSTLREVTKKRTNAE